MIVRQAFRYEVAPTPEQLQMLVQHSGVSRFAWNWALSLAIKSEAPFNAIDTHRTWNSWKRENAPWWQLVSKCAPQESFRDLQRAFVALRQKRSRFPQFKKRGRHDSFRLTGIIHVGERSIQLPRIGVLRTKETTRVEGKILSATVNREADRWFVALAVERDRAVWPQRNGQPIGIDLGLTCFATTSEGERVFAPRPMKQELQRVKRLARAADRKEEGSKNRAKAKLRLAKLHRRIRNRRRDFLHKLTTRLAKTKPALVIEGLRVCVSIKNRQIARGVQDVAWGEFRRMLTYKTEWYGSALVVADRYYPSTQICSGCDMRSVKEITWGQATWSCDCGAVLDRDLNAARNLAKYGTASRAETGPPG